MLSRGLRATLVLALVSGGATVLPSGAAQAAMIDATLIATRDTSVWDRPSPDPSGITYNPVTGQLIISDGEVDEIPSLYAGTNLFLSSLDGVQAADFPGGTTQPHSDEPAGVGYRPSDGHLFVSDDDKDMIFQFRSGPDTRFGTGDDEVTSFSTRLVGGNGDAEGVAVDLDATNDGHVLVIDGVARKIFDYGPGPNGVLDGVAPEGDDTVQSFDVDRHGARDPEGIEFHPGRNTILVLDGETKKVYELNRQGALLNVINITAAAPKSAAGITLAPASDGSRAQHLYIVDRGVDNNTDPDENDGRFYEMAVNFPPLVDGPANAAPSADAGPDRTVVRPNGAALAGSVSDDGLPEPPGAVAVTWSKVSGQGDVMFANANALRTTATFSAAGNYVLRLTADDGALLAADEMTVVVRNSDGSGVLDLPVQAGSDDAEERSDRTILDGNDLELVEDGTAVQKVGLRFAGVGLPQGTTITRAHVQFEVDEPQSGPAALNVVAQAADDTATFTTAAGSVSSRSRTSASVSWTPEAWPTIAARGAAQRTPDLSPVLQEIVSRPGWTSGNAMTFIVTGSGTRTAEAFEGEGGSAKAPVLHVEYGPATAPQPEPQPEPEPQPGQPSGVERYVTKVYDDLLHRAPDRHGLRSWSDALERGVPYGAVANGITASREFRTGLITDSYQRFLGRAPDGPGLEHWLGAMARGLHIEQMQAHFIASSESYRKAGSDDRKWISYLYRTVLGRSAAGAEIDYWQGRLRAGASRYVVALGFVYSTEHLTHVVDGYYQDLLRRSIDPSGRSTWVTAIQRGARDEQIIAAIVSSAEYRSKV